MIEQSDYLLAHMKDLADKAAKTGFAASRFLTPTERQSVAEFFKHRRDVALSFDGGFEGAERTRAAFGLSRAKAAELITAGRVSVNHQLCEQPAKELGEGSLLSVRGMGRAKLLEVGSVSKKGRIFIRIGIYGR
jgi:RNA-binding protein YlmH